MNGLACLLAALENQSRPVLPPLAVAGPTPYSNLASLIATPSEQSSAPSAISPIEPIGRYRSRLFQPPVSEAPTNALGQMLVNISAKY
jgi:hypothetical protein